MAEVDASVAGCCALCGIAALESWCILRPFGANVRCCGGPRGCCGSCCDASFNDDDFDERMKKEQAKKNPNREPANSQPLPSDGMSTAVGEPKPTSVEVS